jgi:purine-nucleoside phosphorylase
MSYEEANQAAEFILAKTSLRPSVALVLGSGLGAFADTLDDAVKIPFGDIPNFPKSTVEGHAGKMVIGRVGDVPIAAMQGRVHFYEGHAMSSVIFPMRVFGRMGIRAAILTNAAGGIADGLKPGSLVVLSDHINMMGTNPLIGPNEPKFANEEHMGVGNGQRFFDMTEGYFKPWRALTMNEGKKLGVNISEGVYLAVTGPSYETPAEIRAFRTMGADVVGMSTVPETIAARHMGIKVLAISCVTNLAAGIGGEPLNHQEVMEVGERVRMQFVGLLKAVIPQIAKDVA